MKNYNINEYLYITKTIVLIFTQICNQNANNSFSSAIAVVRKRFSSNLFLNARKGVFSVLYPSNVEQPRVFLC